MGLIKNGNEWMYLNLAQPLCSVRYLPHVTSDSNPLLNSLDNQDHYIGI